MFFFLFLFFCCFFVFFFVVFFSSSELNSQEEHFLSVVCLSTFSNDFPEAVEEFFLISRLTFGLLNAMSNLLPYRWAKS